MEPDEPAEVEIIKVFNIQIGAEIEIDEKQEKALIEEVFEVMNEVQVEAENNKYERE